MDGERYEEFFLDPQEPLHRHYEALRGVFVDGESMAEVAERLGVAHGTVRNWVCDFRSQCDQVRAYMTWKQKHVADAALHPFLVSLLFQLGKTSRRTWSRLILRTLIK